MVLIIGLLKTHGENTGEKKVSLELNLDNVVLIPEVLLESMHNRHFHFIFLIIDNIIIKLENFDIYLYFIIYNFRNFIFKSISILITLCKVNYLTE